MIKSFLIIFFGGGLGSIMRYAMTLWITKLDYNVKFPFHTFLCNTIGSLLIGLVIGYFGKNNITDIYLLIVVGFLGGFTTFSAFSLETIFLLKQGNIVLSAIYITTTITLCLLFTFVGIWCSNVKIW